MSRSGQRIEQFFAELTRFQFRFPKMILAGWILFFALLWSQMTQIRMETSTESFFHEDDPVLIAYEQFREDYGRDEVIILAIESENIFSLEFLSQLRRLHEELEEKVPNLEEITSMVNARSTYGEADELIVEDLLENFPESEEDLNALRQRVMGNKLYRNLLISAGGDATTLTIRTSLYQSPKLEEGFGPAQISPNKPEPELELLSDEQIHQLLQIVSEVVEKYESEDFVIHLAGSPIVTDNLKLSLKKNMQLFLGMAVGSIAIFLFLLLRRISGMILPLLAVIFSLISTLSVMSYFDTAIKLPTQILPSFLLAVGIGASVHILSIFFVEIRKGKNKEEAMVESMSHSALPIVMTSITTAVGLWSFAGAEVAPIADLGIYSGAGVMICLGVTLFLLPTLIALVPIWTKPMETSESKRGVLDQVLFWLSTFSARHAGKILLVSILVLGFFIGGIPKIRFAHNMVTWLPDSWPVRQASDWIDHKMQGSIMLEFLIDSGKENGFHDPVLLNHLEEMSVYAKSYARENGQTFVGNVITLSDILKEIHKALNNNQEEFAAIPEDPQLIAQEFLLFENSGADELEDVVDSQFRTARFSVKVPWDNAAYYVKFVEDMNAEFKKKFGPEVQISTTGILFLLTTSIDLMMHSTVISYLIAGALITLLMILLLRSLKLGLLSMYPNFFPILITLGMMGWLDIPMDMFSMLIGSIAIGLVVDDTIHFMHNYRRYFAETGSPVKAVEKTLETTGRAMLLTTLVLSTGFGLFMFSPMLNLFYFGWLTAMTLVLALAADLLIAPAMMILLDRRKSDLEKVPQTAGM
ncbi:MAG: MMPL family transporter [SAR324 cluster bacterium]|nr:MMPL family transporter [SAR324 cluster bacterium]